MDEKEIALAFARTFSSVEGAKVLAHLNRITRERHLGPTSSDAELRYLEGQRALVAQIMSLVLRGKRGE